MEGANIGILSNLWILLSFVYINTSKSQNMKVLCQKKINHCQSSEKTLLDFLQVGILYDVSISEDIK